MHADNFNRVYVWFAAAASLAGGTVFLLCSETAADAVRRGIELCGVSVIPSLFPMMFVTQYMMHSGAAELAGRCLDKPTGCLFGLPGVCGVAMLTAFIGGYPAGARTACTLVENGKITPSQGKRLATIAFCSGPGFSIGMIGASLYGNQSAGLLILTAQILSCILLGTAWHLFCPMKAPSASVSEKHAPEFPDNRDAFVNSVVDTAAVMLNMCGFIILFQVITAVSDTAGIHRALGALTEKAGFGRIGESMLPCVTEVTAGSILSAAYGLPFTAFVAGFGGLSVHFQNFAVCRSLHIRKPVYLLTRLIQGILCGWIVFGALKLPCFSSAFLPASARMAGGMPTAFSKGPASFGCTMLIMCLMSVICLPKSPKECSSP